MTTPVRLFISCDWGNSFFRLRIIDADTTTILGELTANKGIKSMYQSWKKTGKDQTHRFLFYRSFLYYKINQLSKQVGFSLQGMPVLLSGLASSEKGILETPYKMLPLDVVGQELIIKQMEPSDAFDHSLIMISGVQTTSDMIQGEEVPLIGCMGDDDKEERIFIFPGIQSKHIHIKAGDMVGITTYMTGELFHLMVNKTTISDAMEETESMADIGSIKSFEKGVIDSKNSNILHTCFLARTNHIFGKLTKEANYFYLWGLMIGTELNSLADNRLPLVLVSEDPLMELYTKACSVLGIRLVELKSAAKALIDGYCKIYLKQLI